MREAAACLRAKDSFQTESLKFRKGQIYVAQWLQKTLILGDKKSSFTWRAADLEISSHLCESER